MLSKPFQISLRWRPSGAVKRHRQPALFGIERETVAADPGHRRFDDRQHSDRRYGRIAGISTATQYIERNQRCERMRSRCHTILRYGCRTPCYIKIAHSSPEFL